MSFLEPKLYFWYLTKLYLKNLLAILFGLAFAFAFIDYFQHTSKLTVTINYKILYIFYMWEQALGLLYPLALVFALIMTKISLVKNGNMGALHAFGYSKKKVFTPFLFVASTVYVIFILLHTTEFSYALDKAKLLLKNEMNSYNVSNLFFKYNDTFVYISKLDPIKKTLTDITIFKVKNSEIKYTINAPLAIFKKSQWEAQNAILKTHIYINGELARYKVEHKKSILTLKGYKPKIIESLYDGKALNIVDAYSAWKLLFTQELKSYKIRASLYNKIIVPLFSLALMLILFFKLPFHARMVNMGGVIALSLGTTFIIWGVLFGLNQMGANGVLLPEITSILPIIALWLYAIYIYFTDERSIS